MMLTNAQRAQLSSICADMAQVSIAGIMIPYLLDRGFNLLLVVFGLISTVAFVMLSLRLSATKL